MPATLWGKGHSGKYNIAKQLLKGAFPAQAVVDIDSMIIDAVFGQHGEKKKIGRVHKVLPLSARNNLSTPITSTAIWLTFERSKKALDFEDPKGYIATAQKIAGDIAKQDPLIKAYGEIGMEIASWYALNTLHINSMFKFNIGA